MTGKTISSLRLWAAGAVAVAAGLVVQIGGGCAGASEQAPAPDTPAPAASLPYPVRLTFHDEFDGFSFFDERSQSGRWRTQFGYGDPAMVESRALANNGERQAYMDRDFHGVGAAPITVDPFRIANGALEITADRVSPAVKKAIWGQDYTSGMIATRFSFAQRYGYFEMRAAMPVGKGFWPAFWLLPMDKSWPPEIDIVEAIGGDHLFFTPHCPGEHSKPAGDMKLSNPGAFHTFGLLWTVDKLRWYVDGHPVAEAAACPAMRRPMYVLVNFAVGGKWPGNPDATTPFPARMKVDYIRVWQLPDEFARD